jgi:hypothetical protein
MAKHHLAFAAVAASLLFVPGKADAELISSRDKPFYIEGAFPLGFSTSAWGGCGRFGVCNWGGYWKPDIELGFHFTGRHDGFVLGIRHSFYLGGFAGMGIAARIGYDIPIPLKGGKYELTIGPYGYVGGAFYGNPAEGAFQTGGGVEGKFFIIKGFYAFARPLDFGVQYFPDFSQAYFQWMFGAGVGYAW